MTSLNPQLSKNIAYVGSFEHFSVQLFFYMYFAIQPRPALTAVIVQDLFGGVVYAGLDTDKYKYPIGELNFNILHKPQDVLNNTQK